MWTLCLQRKRRAFGTSFGMAEMRSIKKLVSMDGICGLYLPREIESKSAALLHAMDLASRRTEKGVVIVDTKKAQKLYDFILSNLSLPDVKTNPEEPILKKCSAVLDTICETLGSAIEARKEVKAHTVA